MALLIQNGRVYREGRLERADLLVEGDRIAAVGEGLPQVPGARVFDASGCVVSPGFTDLHVHLREPGFSHKETVASGPAAAAAGRVHDGMRDAQRLTRARQSGASSAAGAPDCAGRAGARGSLRGNHPRAAGGGALRSRRACPARRRFFGRRARGAVGGNDARGDGACRGGGELCRRPLRGGSPHPGGRLLPRRGVRAGTGLPGHPVGERIRGDRAGHPGLPPKRGAACTSATSRRRRGPRWCARRENAACRSPARRRPTTCSSATGRSRRTRGGSR